MVVAPMTWAWVVLVVGVAGIGVAAHFALRRRAFRTKRAWLLGIAFANLAFSIAFNVSYLVAPAPDTTFPPFQNLPLHLCTIMSWLMPLAVWFDWKPLRAIAFFPGALAGILALFSANPTYWHYDLFDPHTFFWVAHEMNAVIPFLLASLGLYRPTVVQALLSTVWVTALGLVVLPITLALRAWVDPAANYFYVFDPEGAGILELLHEWIGIPILYVLPLPFILLPALLLQWGVYRLANLSRRTLGEGAALPV